MNKVFVKLALISAVVTATHYPATAQAHHRPGHAGGPPHRTTTEAQNGSEEAISQDALSTPLTADQRVYITNLLRDPNHPDAALITSGTRSDIQSQLSSLPPGIQRRLARGRSLPPGIAKKVFLPASINDRIDLNDNVRIVVVGPDVAVIDPVTGLIVDLLRQILL